MSRILTLFGTRPEIIKLAPVIRAFESIPELESFNVSSSQHTDLLRLYSTSFGIRMDRDLKVMRKNQSPDEVCSRILSALPRVLKKIQPEFIVLQGDTTTAMAGALCAFHHNIPVGHVEAGLRTKNPSSPFPEEMNRRIISRLATYHFAPTEHNRQTLLSEGIPDDSIFVTGNPVVDALLGITEKNSCSDYLAQVLEQTRGTQRVVLTTHRRESLGRVMTENLAVLRNFVDRRDDVTLIFPVHPNPSVVNAAEQVLAHHPRIHLIEPLGYPDFIHLLSRAWLIVSDSGGVQEEAPTLGKGVLVIRENTERPEAVDAGFSRLVGGDPITLAEILNNSESLQTWVSSLSATENPFGSGDSGQRIAAIVADLVGSDTAIECATTDQNEKVMSHG